MIFFKIVCYFADWAQGNFDNLRILGTVEAIYHFEINFSCIHIFCNPFPAVMEKIFWGKSKSSQKYFGFKSGSVLFVHPVHNRKIFGLILRKKCLPIFFKRLPIGPNENFIMQWGYGEQSLWNNFFDACVKSWSLQGGKPNFAGSVFLL